MINNNLIKLNFNLTRAYTTTESTSQVHDSNNSITNKNSINKKKDANNKTQISIENKKSSAVYAYDIWLTKSKVLNGFYSLAKVPQTMYNRILSVFKTVKNVKKTNNWGVVVSAGDGVANVTGLPKLQMGEIVVFHTIIGAVKGITLTLNGNYARIAIFGNESSISQGTEVAQNKEVARVPIGVNVLGRIIDPLGNPLDQKGIIQTQRFIKSDRKAKGIIYRKSINEPFLTGIIAIDTMIPIGRGQRELIIGDRQLGKTSIALDAIINQNRISDSTKMFCVYVAIGQKKTTILQISRVLEETRANSYTVIVSASADESAALQYLAPYAGTAIAEYFRDNGRHSLVVLDDLSKHAIAYRQMSLLVRRPPGRDAYPGDVFYLHSRLLERGSKLSMTFGGGSLTVLPIIETMENDVSAYIPTNVISITDGQIYIDKKVARQGILPAVNVGLSVSRIGSAAQLKNIKITSGALKLQLTKYREVEHFLTFASEIDDETLTLIYRGIRILEILKQKRFKPLSIAQQLGQLYAVLSGAMDRLPVEFMQIMKTYINSIATRISYTNIIGKGYEVYLSGIARSIRNISTYNTIKAKIRRTEYKQNVQAWNKKHLSTADYKNLNKLLI